MTRVTCHYCTSEARGVDEYDEPTCGEPSCEPSVRPMTPSERIAWEERDEETEDEEES